MNPGSNLDLIELDTKYTSETIRSLNKNGPRIAQLLRNLQQEAAEQNIFGPRSVCNAPCFKPLHPIPTLSPEDFNSETFEKPEFFEVDYNMDKDLAEKLEEKALEETISGKTSAQMTPGVEQSTHAPIPPSQVGTTQGSSSPKSATISPPQQGPKVPPSSYKSQGPYKPQEDPTTEFEKLLAKSRKTSTFQAPPLVKDKPPTQSKKPVDPSGSSGPKASKKSESKDKSSGQVPGPKKAGTHKKSKPTTGPTEQAKPIAEMSQTPKVKPVGETEKVTTLSENPDQPDLGGSHPLKTFISGLLNPGAETFIPGSQGLETFQDPFSEAQEQFGATAMEETLFNFLKRYLDLSGCKDTTELDKFLSNALNHIGLSDARSPMTEYASALEEINLCEGFIEGIIETAEKKCESGGRTVYLEIDEEITAHGTHQIEMIRMIFRLLKHFSKISLVLSEDLRIRLEVIEKRQKTFETENRAWQTAMLDEIREIKDILLRKPPLQQEGVASQSPPQVSENISISQTLPKSKKRVALTPPTGLGLPSTSQKDPPPTVNPPTKKKSHSNFASSEISPDDSLSISTPAIPWRTETRLQFVRRCQALSIERPDAERIFQEYRKRVEEESSRAASSPSPRSSSGTVIQSILKRTNKGEEQKLPNSQVFFKALANFDAARSQNLMSGAKTIALKMFKVLEVEKFLGTPAIDQDSDMPLIIEIMDACRYYFTGDPRFCKARETLLAGWQDVSEQQDEGETQENESQDEDDFYSETE